MRQLDYIEKMVETELKKIQNITPETYILKRCPICHSETLESGHKGTHYHYYQALYHLKLRNVPQRAFCIQCTYQMLGEKVETVSKLELVE